MERSGAAAPLIVVIGDAALDISLDVGTLDGVDEKVAATASRRELGGTGANAAAAITRLGGRARLHAAVGSDACGDFILGELRAHGIETSGVAVIDGASTTAVILRSPDRRLVVVDRGVADHEVLSLSTIRAGASLIYVSAMPWKVISGVILDNKLPVVVGLEARQAPDLLAAGTPASVAAVLDRARVVITNEAGVRALIGICRQLRSAILVVTRGAAGARVERQGQPPYEVPAAAVDVVDATGAGDCFAGAFCYFLAIGSPLDQAVRLATIAASLSVQQLGAQAGLPTESDVRAEFEGRVD